MYPSESFDIAALAISVILLASYHIIHITEVYLEQNEVFNLSINSKITDLWVDKYFNSRNPEGMMEVIHALRNTVLIAIFLGGYTLESSYSLMSPPNMGFLPSSGGSSHRRMAASMAIDSPSDIGNIVLIICLFSSFICWLQVLRNCIHLGFVIDGWDGPVIPYEHVSSGLPTLPSMQIRATCPVTFSLSERKAKFCVYAKFLARNSIVYFSFAFRFLFVSIPFGYYSIGSAALLASTCVVLALEVLWDYQLF